MCCTGYGAAVLGTERLVLRRFTDADVDALVELDGDPEVMRFLTGGQATPRDVVVRERLPKMMRYRTGLGYWVAQARADGGFVGWFGLCPSDGRPGEAELGYRLRRAVWGSGLATEGALALLRLGFTEFGVRRVTATTMTANVRSRRVLEKVGLSYVRTWFGEWPEYIEGAELGDVDYAVTREAWLARWS